MKILLFSLSIFFTQVCGAVEYLSPDKINTPKEELSLIEQNPEKLVQGIFWYIHSPYQKNTIIFSATNDKSYGNQFTPSESTEFMIIGVEDGVYNKNRKVFKVLFPDDKEGYIQAFYFNLNLKLTVDSDEAYYGDFISYKNPSELEKAKIENQKAESKKRNVKIGMNKKQVLNSKWGKPETVNMTTTNSGISEQWVYGSNRYLYFENGKLKAIQE